jgi:hypothetical protein
MWRSAPIAILSSPENKSFWIPLEELNGFRKNMGEKKIRRNNSDFLVHHNSSRPTPFGPLSFFGAHGSSYAPVFLPVILLAGNQH